MKPRHLLMAAGIAISTWLAFFGDKTPGGGVAEPVAHRNAKAGVPAKRDTAQKDKDKAKPEPVILALRPRAELIGGASGGNSAALFGSQSWTPAPVLPTRPVVPPPPTAPALDYTYIGKKLDDAKWEVYLSKGEQTFIVREKTTVEDVYRVESIKPPMLTLTYLPLNQMQTMNIGGAE